MIDDLQSLSDSNDVFQAQISGISVDASQVAGIKTPAKLEQIITKNYEVKPGNLLIIEWKNLEDEILVSSDRTIFISEKVCKFSYKF